MNNLRNLAIALSLSIASTAAMAQSVPTGLSVDASPSGSGIVFSWAVSPNNATYDVYRDGFLIGNTTEGSFPDSLVPSDSTASYFVTGCTAERRCSSPSLSAMFWPGDAVDAPDPNVIGIAQNVRIEDFGDGTAVLSWDPVVGAEKYNIDKNFNYLATTQLTAGTLRVTNLDLQGFPQFEADAVYRVSAIDEDQADPFGAWSAGVSAQGVITGDDISALELQIAGLEQTLADRDATILQLETTIANGGDSSALLLQITGLEETIATRDATIVTLQTQITTLNEMIVVLQTEIDNGTGSTDLTELIAALTAANQEIGTLTTQLTLITTERDNLLASSTELQTQIDSLTGNLVTVSDDLDAQIIVNNELLASNEALTADNATLTADNETLTADVTQLASDLQICLADDS